MVSTRRVTGISRLKKHYTNRNSFNIKPDAELVKVQLVNASFIDSSAGNRLQRHSSSGGQTGHQQNTECRGSLQQLIQFMNYSNTWVRIH